MSGAAWRKDARFVVVPVSYGRQFVTGRAVRSVGSALRSVARDVDAYAGGVGHPARAQADALPTDIIARVVFVPAGEPDDYDGTVCAEVRAGWGCA